MLTKHPRRWCTLRVPLPHSAWVVKKCLTGVKLLQATIPVGWIVSDERTSPVVSYVLMPDGSHSPIIVGKPLPWSSVVGADHRPDGSDVQVDEDRPAPRSAKRFTTTADGGLQ